MLLQICIYINSKWVESETKINENQRNVERREQEILYHPSDNRN